MDRVKDGKSEGWEESKMGREQDRKSEKIGRVTDGKGKDGMGAIVKDRRKVHASAKTVL